MSDTGTTALEQRPPGPDQHWLWPVSIAVLALALVASLIGGSLLVLGQQRQVRALEADLAQTRAELAEVEAELAEARRAPSPGPEGGGGLGGLLDDLLGGEGLGGALEGLDLEGLLEGLGGGADAPDAELLSCLGDLAEPGTRPRPIESGDAAAQVQAIAERVEEIRGLSFAGDVDATFLGPEEFAAEVRQAFDEDYAPADADLDERLLRSLGAIPADMDLRARYIDLISGQAAGFYRSDTREIVVLGDPDDVLDPSTQVTLAHELEHALADEHIGLPEPDADDGDAGRAALTVIEGGATLAMQQFAARSLGMMAQLSLGMDPAAREAQEQLATFPHYLQRDLVFPYEAGLSFACRVHADGGWDALDAAYAAPPTTTAQILWPQRWDVGDAGRTPGFADAPAGWTAARTTTIGAADLLWLFEAPGDEVRSSLDDPLGRAAGWDGGALRLLTRGEDTAVGMALAQRPDERDLCASIGDWYSAAFFADQRAIHGDGEESWEGAAQHAWLSCADDEVRLGIGPDEATARAALEG